MWLWKKFWNTDIVGKTYILIILFIVIVATITIITRYNNANTNQVLNEQQNEVIQDAVHSEQIQENVTSENIIDIAETQENIEKESITDKPKNEVQEKSVIKINKEDNKNTAQTETKEEVKTKANKEETIVEKKEETIEIIEENKEKRVEEKNQEEILIIRKEDKQEETKEDKQEDIITEEYKINNQMINQLKETIKNNETEDMKNYGYEIVVDSSIVEITNQFTFTEYRVKNKLALKYGTIRIYARDYYYNGTYITTQCFII